ncbi:MAG TPA: hypothetical protein VKA36_04055 [Solirubrobacterales bacterium]|nr:hypothetical protein [Solirubrobacterales bacterium]
MAESETAEEQSCAVCGRRLLLGERSSPYVSREGAEVAVCELCKARAESAGWMRPEEVEAGSRSGPGRRRRRRRGDLLGGLLARNERRRGDGGERAAGADRAEVDQAPPDDPDSEPSEAREPEQPVERQRRAQRGAGRRRSSGEAPRTTASAAGPDVNEAVKAFNASENRRTIAGLSRSLGEPKVTAIAVRTASGSTGARVTVAWELAWYQWEVGPGKRGPEIRQTAKGETTDQLHAADRKWNLNMDADGTLSPRSASGS